MIPRRRADFENGELWTALRRAFLGPDISGRAVPEFEEAFAAYISSRHAVSVGSGRIAMELILRSLELEGGDEVIMPAYTLKDLIPIIRSLGLRAVAADIEPETFSIDPASVEARITPRTKVIMATHLFGSPCRIDRILDIAARGSISVIEDCAHSAAATFLGRETGSFGRAAFFSFEAMKPINTYGGGMVTTDDDTLASRIRRQIESGGVRGKAPLGKVAAAFIERRLLPTPFAFPALYLLASPAWNTKMSALYRKALKPPAPRSRFTEFQAEVGLARLKTVDGRVGRRREQADMIRSLLAEEVRPQRIIEGACSSCYFFVALLPGRAQEIRMSLLKRGIDAGVAAEIADDCSGLLGQENCPNAKTVFQRAIQLPLHEGMSDSDIRYVAETLNGEVRVRNEGIAR